MSIEPLPAAGITKILGLCETLSGLGGQENLYRVAHAQQMALGEFLWVLKGAEMIGLVQTSQSDCALTEVGKKIVSQSPAEKKALLKAQMLKLQIFEHLVKVVESSEAKALPGELIVEQLAVLLPHEQPRQLFSTLLNWGRYAEIFAYSRDTDLFGMHSDGAG